MLQAADVDKLRCNFVFDVYEYFKCKKYSLSCCNDVAKQSYMDFKLAEKYECPIDVHEDCRLQTIESKVDVVECTPEDFECSLQGGVKLTATTDSVTYTTTLENWVNGSAYPMIVQGYGLYQPAGIDFVTRDNLGNIVDTHRVWAGSIKIGGVVTSDDSYKLGAYTLIKKENITNVAGSYLTSVRLERTDSAGNPTGLYTDFNVSPIDSPYLASPVAVTPADLYFTSPNFPTAIAQVLRNGVFAITGDVDDVDVVAQFAGVNGFKVKTRINNGPQALWWGIPKTGELFRYYNGSTGLTTTQFGPFVGNVESHTGNFYATYDLTLPSGDVETLQILNTPITMSPNTSSTYYNLVFASTFGVQPLTISGQTVTTDTTVYLNAVVTTTQSYTSEWRDPSNVLVASTSNVMLHNPVSGTYTFTAILASGCEISQTIEI